MTTFLPKLGQGREVGRSHVTGCEAKIQVSKSLISLPEQYCHGAWQKDSLSEPNTARLLGHRGKEVPSDDSYSRNKGHIKMAGPSRWERKIPSGGRDIRTIISYLFIH